MFRKKIRVGRAGSKNPGGIWWTRSRMRAVPRHLRRWWIVRGEEGAGVEVVGDAVVATVKGGEEVPLVPSDAGHAFEEWIDIDSDGDLLPAVHDTVLEASPAGAQGANRVAGDIDEETDCGREAVEHGSTMITQHGSRFDVGHGHGHGHGHGKRVGWAR